MRILCPATIALCAIVISTGPAPAVAQWTGDGNLVAAASWYESEPQIISDDAGGVVIVFTRDGYDGDNIAIQRLDLLGVRLWGTYGRTVCGADGNQSRPDLTLDSDGDVVVAWTDNRAPQSWLYMQKVGRADGWGLWTEDGVGVNQGAAYARVIPDGNDGTFVVWEEYVTAPPSIAILRMTDSGWSAWGNFNDYVVMGTSHTPMIVPDGDGGAVVGFRHWHGSTNYSVRGQRIDSDGDLLWASDEVSPGYGTFGAPIVADGTGGGIWVWRDGNDAVVQHVDGAGALQWGTSGRDAFPNMAGTCTEARIVSDGAGGVIVATIVADDYIYAQWIDSNGSLHWGSAGVQIYAGTTTLQGMEIAPDGHGGAYVAWADDRDYGTTGRDVYAQHVDASGSVQWAAAGVPICTATGNQQDVQISETGVHSAVICWSDGRDFGTTNYDIYAQAIHFDGSIGDPPFEVISTTAIQNGIFRPIEDSLEIVCNQDIDAATFNSGTIEVWGSHTGPMPGFYSVAGNVATFDLWYDFDHGEVVTAVATSGIQSTGGDALAPFCWSYTTLSDGADGALLAPESYAAQIRPIAVAAGDIDGDDILDIATTNYNSATVSVFIGNGDGTFGTANNLAVGTNPHSVVLANVDNDNDVDVVVANYGSDNLTVWRNAGDGTFPLYSGYTTGNGPESVCVADFDNDGVMDMATADLNADEISILMGNGFGGFVRTANHAAGDNPIFIVAGDLDNDGWTDLVTSNFASADVSIFMNAAGAFGARTDHTVGTFPATVHPADLDGDGWLDLVAAAGGSQELVLLFNDGAGGFGAAVPFATSSGPHGGQPTDVDGDGDLDLVYGCANADEVRVRLNDGSGGFGAETAFAAGNFPSAVATGDFDGDGAMDVVTANRYDDDVTVLLNHHSLSGTGDGGVPAVTALRSITPNPFNPETRISYSLRETGLVRLTVHDARGRLVATLVDRRQEVGERSVTWDGRHAASGVYFVRLVTDAGRETRKMTMIK